MAVHHVSPTENAKSKGRRRLHAMHIERAAKGGFIVRHEHRMSGGGGYAEPRTNDTHALESKNAMLEHVGQSWGGGGGDEEGEAAAAGPTEGTAEKA